MHLGGACLVVLEQLGQLSVHLVVVAELLLRLFAELQDKLFLVEFYAFFLSDLDKSSPPVAISRQPIDCLMDVPVLPRESREVQLEVGEAHDV